MDLFAVHDKSGYFCLGGNFAFLCLENWRAWCGGWFRSACHNEASWCMQIYNHHYYHYHNLFLIEYHFAFLSLNQSRSCKISKNPSPACVAPLWSNYSNFAIVQASLLLSLFDVIWAHHALYRLTISLDIAKCSLFHPFILLFVCGRH